jgi:hypothetical protein
LGAELGRRPSYTWRSIWNSRKLLNEGLFWRVGDGQSISIWGDKWLPKPTPHIIQSPIRSLDSSAKVCDLLDRDTNWWKIDLIHEIFHREEAEESTGHNC